MATDVNFPRAVTRARVAAPERIAGWAGSPVRRALLLVGRRAVARAIRKPGSVQGAHLSGIVRAFLFGYIAALREATFAALNERLNEQQPEMRGFAFEGAAMGLALIDAILPPRTPRLLRFIDGPAAPHLYMACVGAGWAAARLRRRADRARRGLDALLGWLAVDGYGFHEAFFKPDLIVRRRVVPSRVSGYAARVFDQGVGRALWFVESSDSGRIARTIATFPADRRADLWSGIALAATYAGGVSTPDFQALRADAHEYPRQIAQGAAFAAEARIRARNLVPHTETACEVFAGCRAEEAASIVRELRRDAADDGCVPAYEVWRRRIGAALHGDTL